MSRKQTNKKPKSKNGYKNIISVAVARAGRKGVSTKELLIRCKANRNDKNEFFRQLDGLASCGAIVEYRKRWVLASAIGAVPATVVRLNKTFGFVKLLSDETDLFVAGRYLMGAMTGDTVLVKLTSTEKGPEGHVVAITQKTDSTFTGVITEENGVKFIQPDSICNFPIMLSKGQDDYKIGQKVVAMIEKRGASHREHRAAIVAGFGLAENASACADAYLAANGISIEFPNACIDEAAYVAKQKISSAERASRDDFTNQKIFTIDSAESKDLDDAVSVEKMGDNYILGVHIADVSYYVKDHSELDHEAYERGTSIYFADRVIPMLPKQLSNGICSLNPNEERLTFSAIITLDKSGDLIGFQFKKSIINSVVKGVYSEINNILAGNETDEIKEKYKGLYNEIAVMDELADILIQKRKLRGAPDIDTSESKIIVEDGVAVDVVPRTRGKSEMIIEEFMLMANRCAAIFARENELPFVYRIHEDPPAEKIDNLKTILRAMGISCESLKDGKNPAELSAILKQTEEHESFAAINRMVVRSMAKAKYSYEPIGHYGLALDDYTHFTSPIRRYPDLTIHRIMSSFLASNDRGRVTKRFSRFATASAEQSTKTELNAVKIERDVEDCYKAEYMKKHIGEEFNATVSSVTSFGFFAELQNTVEGLVGIGSLPDGEYIFEDGVKLVNVTAGRSFTLGQKVRVKCVKADVNSGRIDFEIVV